MCYHVSQRAAMTLESETLHIKPEVNQLTSCCCQQTKFNLSHDMLLAVVL